MTPELWKTAVDLVTGAGVMVTLVYVFKFSRWTGIVDTRLKSLEERIANGGLPIKDVGP